MSGWAWSGWAGPAVLAVCAAVGWWHHRRDAARVARCAHELRGSLGALRLGLDLALARGGLSPERLGALDLQLARAAAAVDDLTDSGRERAEQTVRVPALLGDSVSALQPLAVSSGADLRLDDVPDVAVLGDRARLAQALSNLIANAIEHGGRRIRVGGRVGEGAVRLEVRDDGPGVANLRERRRGRTACGLPVCGPHGHGLAVASDVAASHQGRLLSAPVQNGTRIVLELPLFDQTTSSTCVKVGTCQ